MNLALRGTSFIHAGALLACLWGQGIGYRSHGRVGRRAPCDHTRDDLGITEAELAGPWERLGGLK